MQAAEEAATRCAAPCCVVDMSPRRAALRCANPCPEAGYSQQARAFWLKSFAFAILPTFCPCIHQLPNPSPLALHAALPIMVASQSSTRDRLLYGGLGLTMLLHALVLFGGRTAAPAAPALPAGAEQHGRPGHRPSRQRRYWQQWPHRRPQCGEWRQVAGARWGGHSRRAWWWGAWRHASKSQPLQAARRTAFSGCLSQASRRTHVTHVLHPCPWLPPGVQCGALGCLLKCNAAQGDFVIPGAWWGIQGWGAARRMLERVVVVRATRTPAALALCCLDCVACTSH